MDKSLFNIFETLVRKVHSHTDEVVKLEQVSHQFSERNIHENMPLKVRELFDDGHFSQATFEAFKFLDKEVSRIAKISESGYNLMMKAFAEASPLITLGDLSTSSGTDEQKGFKFIFSGSIMAIRNPRGHEYTIEDSLEDCLDYLSLVSLLLRKIDRRII